MRIFLLFVGLALNSSQSFAKDVPFQLRIFAGAAQVKPEDMNQELESMSYKTLKTLPQVGIEATYPVTGFLDFGIRFTKSIAQLKEQNAAATSTAQIDFDQDAVALVARVPLMRAKIFKLDTFAGLGGANTKAKFQTATQNGELSRTGAFDWGASPYLVYGASVAVGFNKFFFAVEGGMQSVKAKDFKRTGTVNSNIEQIDLAGSYVAIALVFDGLAANK